MILGTTLASGNCTSCWISSIGM